MSGMPFGEVIGAFEDAGIDSRDAYWAYPHRSSDGNKVLVLIVEGREYSVASVSVDEDRILVVCEPVVAPLVAQDPKTSPSTHDG